MRAQCGAGDIVGPEFRRRRGARTADRGHDRRRRRRHRRSAGAGDEFRHLPALSFDRRAWRRNRRRRQERAGDCVRHRHRTRPWRQRVGGADHARLCRDGALRQSLRRAYRNSQRIVGAGRSHSHLLVAAVAQFFVRRRARQGHAAGRQIGRRRFHRAGAVGNGARQRCRHADLDGGRRRDRQEIECR